MPVYEGLFYIFIDLLTSRGQKRLLTWSAISFKLIDFFQFFLRIPVYEGLFNIFIGYTSIFVSMVTNYTLVTPAYWFQWLPITL